MNIDIKSWSDHSAVIEVDGKQHSLSCSHSGGVAGMIGQIILVEASGLEGDEAMALKAKLLKGCREHWQAVERSHAEADALEAP